MLLWICPECGNECEPTDRDCPTCYPLDEPVLVGTKPAAVLTSSNSHKTSASTSRVAPPPLPPPSARLQNQQSQPNSVTAVIPAFLLPAHVGDQTLRLPVPGFLGSPAALARPPLLNPPSPALENIPVPAGLRALSNTMRAWDRSRGSLAASLNEPEPLFSGREESGVNVLFPRDSTGSSEGPSGPPEPARCESLEVLDPPAFRVTSVWRSPDVAGANALQFATESMAASRPMMEAPPSPNPRVEFSLITPVDEAEPEPPACAGLQPLLVRLQPSLVVSPAASAGVRPVPISSIPAAPVLSLPERLMAVDGPDRALPFGGLLPIDLRPDPKPALPPLGFPILGVDAQLPCFQAVPRLTPLPEVAQHPRLDSYTLPSTPLRPLVVVLRPQSAISVQPLPNARGYWPWPGPAAPAGKPVLGAMRFDMDPAVLQAVEPPKALVLALRPNLAVRAAEPTTASAVLEPEILIPIVESSTPPLARLVPLPKIGIRPRSVFLRPGRVSPSSEFALREPYVPQRRSARLIPSPIYSEYARNKPSIFTSSSPGWLVTALIALLIPIGALGIVNYWILPAQRASAASTPAQSAQPPADPDGTAAAGDALPPNWKKVVEITGIRLQDGRAQYIVVNHGKVPIPSTTVLVTLRSASAAAKGLPPVGSFQVRFAPLAPKESREMSSAIQMAPVGSSSGDVDWTDMRAELQLVK